MLILRLLANLLLLRRMRERVRSKQGCLHQLPQKLLNDKCDCKSTLRNSSHSRTASFVFLQIHKANYLSKYNIHRNGRFKGFSWMSNERRDLKRLACDVIDFVTLARSLERRRIAKFPFDILNRTEKKIKKNERDLQCVHCYSLEQLFCSSRFLFFLFFSYFAFHSCSLFNTFLLRID